MELAVIRKRERERRKDYRLGGLRERVAIVVDNSGAEEIKERGEDVENPSSTSAHTRIRQQQQRTPFAPVHTDKRTPRASTRLKGNYVIYSFFFFSFPPFSFESHVIGGR